MSNLLEVIEPHLTEEGVDREALIGSITSYVEKAKNEATEKLAANKQEIINEKRELSEKYKTLNDSVSWLEGLDEPLTQDKYNDIQAEVSTLREGFSKSEGELADKLNKKYEAGKENAGSLYQPKVDALTQKLKETESTRDDYKNKFQNYLVQNKINEAIQKTGAIFPPYYRDGFASSAKPTFSEDGLEGISVGHNGTQIPLEEWVVVYPNTPEGKSFIPAGVNTGGGAKGSGSGSKSPKTIDDIDTNLSPEARRAALKKLYNK